MKLLYITNQICGSGGLERVLAIKASYLADVLGYEVHIITLNQNKAPLFYTFSNKLIYHDICVKGNPFKYIYNYVFKLRAAVKTINPDVISVCDDGLKGFFAPIILSKPCPMVYERHASKNIFKHQDELSLLKRIQLRLLDTLMHIGGRKYNRFIVLTKNNLREWQLNNLQVIPNPLSFYPEDKSTLNNLKVISVGNHGFQKGYDRLLKIWKIVSAKFPKWQLEIYGKIDADEQHIKLAQSLGIKSSVSFFNPIKNIQSKYLEASIYTMSSRSEGFGMVLIEAMACGVPCVSFDCPSGPRDIITNNEDGFLVENGNIEAFAKKMEALMANEPLRQHMGTKAREKASLYFPERIVAKWDALFKELTNKAL